MAGGRHSYEGLAQQDGYLTVDISNMTKVGQIVCVTLALLDFRKPLICVLIPYICVLHLYIRTMEG